MLCHYKDVIFDFLVETAFFTNMLPYMRLGMDLVLNFKTDITCSLGNKFRCKFYGKKRSM